MKPYLCVAVVLLAFLPSGAAAREDVPVAETIKKLESELSLTKDPRRAGAIQKSIADLLRESTMRGTASQDGTVSVRQIMDELNRRLHTRLTDTEREETRKHLSELQDLQKMSVKVLKQRLAEIDGMLLRPHIAGIERDALARLKTTMLTELSYVRLDA